jgi:hypothetical protein
VDLTTHTPSRLPMRAMRAMKPVGGSTGFYFRVDGLAAMGFL